MTPSIMKYNNFITNTLENDMEAYDKYNFS